MNNLLTAFAEYTTISRGKRQPFFFFFLSPGAMPRERLPTAAGTFMHYRKVSDILKVQRWEAVRGHSSDLILKKKRKSEKDKKMDLCLLRASSLRLAFTAAK